MHGRRVEGRRGIAARHRERVGPHLDPGPGVERTLKLSKDVEDVRIEKLGGRGVGHIAGQGERGETLVNLPSAVDEVAELDDLYVVPEFNALAEVEILDVGAEPVPRHLEVLIELVCVGFLGRVECGWIEASIAERTPKGTRVLDKVLDPDEDMPRDGACDEWIGEVYRQMEGDLYLFDNESYLLDSALDHGSTVREISDGLPPTTS